MPAGVDHAVQRRRIEPVGPALDQLGDVDDEGSGYGRRGDPLAGTVAQLQPGHGVLGQYGQEAVVAVRAAAQRRRLDPALLWRIVDQPEVRDRPGRLFSGPAAAKAVATRRSAFRFRQWAFIIGPVPANFGKHSLTKIVDYSR